MEDPSSEHSDESLEGEDLGNEVPVNENLEWYTLRTFSGHEKKVRRLLKEEIDRLGLEERITEIVIPK